MRYQKYFTKVLTTLTLGVLATATQAAPLPFFAGLGTTGGATSHGDTLSSDTSPLRGPAFTSKAPQLISLSAACPNLMVLSDGKVAALCVDYLTRQPKLTLFSRDGKQLSQIMLSSASLLGSVYAYANEKDEIVYVDAFHNLKTVSILNQNGKWTLHNSLVPIAQLARTITAHCNYKQHCDSVVAINPGSSTNDIWFATQHGVVGVVDRVTKRVISKKLNKGESIANSFSTALNNRASVVTTHATYLLAKENNQIVVKWRQAYDRGIARKPGQLSWGSGATPTFFGTNANNDEYITITDNAQRMNLLVYRTHDGKQICKVPLFNNNNSGTEDSSIAYGRGIVTTSTYGYPYPKYPDGAGKSIPKKAAFIGGMTRVDVRADGMGCETKWTSPIRSSALPKLSIPDNLIYTIERTGPSKDATALDTYNFVTMNWDTGLVKSRKFWSFGALSNPLQTAGNFGLDNSYWQGTMNGIIRIKP
ncbi:hypothetical protein [Faucicola boevrei]|uniref:hypothetical protein n=1 Tax=Faucicola boevrei TaxID=346665 RepID=UPI00037C4AB8|nr:hypothetical protein [Moraxella boevrei]